MIHVNATILCRARMVAAAAVLMTVLLTASVGPLPAARAQDSDCAAHHTIVLGENLFRISLHYGVSMSEIAAANGISDVTRIYAGNVLCIPKGGTGVTNIATSPAGTTTASGPAPSTTPTTQSLDTSAGLPTDNWCYWGGPWGDGRCSQGTPAENSFLWNCGWYHAHNLPNPQCGIFSGLAFSGQVNPSGCSIVVTAQQLTDVTAEIHYWEQQLLATCPAPIVVIHNPAP